MWAELWTATFSLSSASKDGAAPAERTWATLFAELGGSAEEGLGRDAFRRGMWDVGYEKAVACHDKVCAGASRFELRVPEEQEFHTFTMKEAARAEEDDCKPDDLAHMHERKARFSKLGGRTLTVVGHEKELDATAHARGAPKRSGDLLDDLLRPELGNASSLSGAARPPLKKVATASAPGPGPVVTTPAVAAYIAAAPMANQEVLKLLLQEVQW